MAEDARRKLYDAVEDIESQRDTGAALAAAAENAGFAVQQFGPVDAFSFGSGGEIVADIPGEVLRSAFQLEEGDESEAIEFGDDSGYYFVSLSETTPPAPIPYETVADEVEQSWRRQERNDRISNTLSQIRDAISGGASFADAAEPFGGESQERALTRRQTLAPFTDPLQDQVFSANLNSIVSGGGASQPNQVLARVKEIVFDGTQVSAGEEIALKRYLSLQYDQELLEAYASALRSDYGVKTNPALIESIFNEPQ